MIVELNDELLSEIGHTYLEWIESGINTNDISFVDYAKEHIKFEEANAKIAIDKPIQSISINGYANLYLNKRTDCLGKVHNDYFVGEICRNIKDVPNYYEYDCAAHKHKGVVNVVIKQIEVKPLFKVGDKVCQKKDRDFVVTINSITNGLYLCDVYDKDGDYDDDYCFSVSEQDQWALVDKCQGCNNVKGCVTCHNGDE